MHFLAEALPTAPGWLDPAFHFISVAFMAVIGYYVRRLVRLVEVSRDFPPHRHVADNILYPEGFAVGKVQGR
jgi:hypothetical protein